MRGADLTSCRTACRAATSSRAMRSGRPSFIVQPVKSMKALEDIQNLLAGTCPAPPTDEVTAYADTYVHDGASVLYRLRAPSHHVPCVPEAQGSLPLGLGRAVRTMYHVPWHHRSPRPTLAAARTPSPRLRVRPQTLY